MLELIQGTQEWRQARCGSLGASSLHEAIARIKTGYGASRANLMARLIAELLTGVPQEGFQNASMLHGIETEPEARSAYEFYSDVAVEQVGLILHPEIKGTHASPDGLVNDDGLVEIKCPNTATHIETLLTGAIPEKYIVQMTWQMSCAGRSWCDFVSYDPRLPEEMRLYTRRIDRDEELIKNLEKEVRLFLSELNEKVAGLRKLYGCEVANAP